MKPGDVVGERFELEGRAGSGGMGEVFRARDRTNGEVVALKVLLDGRSPEEARFDREAAALADLHHPGIVRYIAHGTTFGDKPYIAMEWLDGEELATRLARGKLAVDESVTVIARAAEALAVAHARGIIHRDLKPSNIFLVGHDVERVKILDFGIAKLRDRTKVTQTGMTLGTPGYMAPEQARSGQEIDARADIFALGCVLFECLTGAPLYTGEHFMAILAKILFEETPRLRDLRPELPAELDALLARMLAKKRDERPRDGSSLCAEVAALGTEWLSVVSDAGGRITPPPATELTGGERHLLSVVLLGGRNRKAFRITSRSGSRGSASQGSVPPGATASEGAASPEASASTQGSASASPAQPPFRPMAPLSTPPSPFALTSPAAPALVISQARFVSAPSPSPPPRNIAKTPLEDELRRAAEARGGRFELLADGSVAITIAGGRVATDQAAQAARASLALRALAPGRPIALATGQGKVTARLPTGEVIDRAARMLEAAPYIPEDPDPSSPPPSVTLLPIAIDEITAGLLDPAFDVARDGEHLRLHGERRPAEDAGGRTLLGKPTACVGRDRELTTLETVLTECAEEPMSQAVIVTGAPGIGKSRLVHELLRWARKREPAAELWIGRGDSLRAGSAFGLLAQALRGACGILEGEPLFVRQEKLVARVAANVPMKDQARVAEFLGELMGTPLPDDESAALFAARQDAELMGEQMRWAWEEFAAAESAQNPVVLVLEDLHWGDLPTVRFVDAALRSLRDRAFMVVATARPELSEVFPKLWAERRVHEVRLKELTRKASERLVRQVLGNEADAGTVERVVVQAEGNPFYLEELIRAVADGRGAALPATALAMVQARLEGLETEARRVLRAASVFGEVFWEGGVSALLGASSRAAAGEWLRMLVDREVLLRRPESRFPGEPELAFRHALLREGAYAMLTDEDRALGHRLAGEWLEPRGESDPMMLAEHFERGNDPARAGIFYLRAAEQAYRGGDSKAATARARRGLLAGVTDGVRVALQGLLCEVSGWRSDAGAAAPPVDVEEVMRLATPGSVPWCRAAIAKLGGAMRLGDVDAFIATLDEMRAVDPAPGAAGIVAGSLVFAVHLLDSRGRFDLAEVILRRMTEVVGPVAERDPVARGWMHLPRAYHEVWVKEDPWVGLRRSEAARESFLAGSHRRGALVSQIFVGMSAWCLGALDRAKQALSATPLADEELGPLGSFRPFCLIGVLADLGALDEARAEASRMVAGARARGARIEEGRGRWAMADVLLRENDLAGAEREAHAALDLLAGSRLDHVAATVTLAAIKLAEGRVAEALSAAEAAMNTYEALRSFGFRGAFARLIYAEALHAAGEVEASSAALTAARQKLMAQASKIEDAEMRRSFLRNVPANARTLELFGEFPGESDLLGE